MTRLTRLVTRHPVATLMIWLSIVVLGLVSLSMLRVELLPSVEIKEITVTTGYGAMPAAEIETLVTIPIEDALASVHGIRSIEAISTPGRSAVGISFDWGANLMVAATEVRERIDSVFPLLPHGASKPLVITRDVSNRPLMVISVIPGPARTMTEVSRLVHDELVPSLRQQPGIASVEVIGSFEPLVSIDVDPHRLQIAGLGLRDLADVVTSALVERPAGRLLVGRIEQPVRVRTDIGTIDDLERIPIQRGSAALMLQDVARVSITDADRISFFLSGPRQAVGLLVFKDSRTGSPAAAASLKRAIEELRPVLSHDVELVIEHDGSQGIRDAMNSMFTAVALGIIAAVLVLSVIFRDPRIIGITAGSIPVCILASFLPLHALGVSLNTVSLSGVAIGVGMIVDNSIVVVTRLALDRETTAESVAGAAATMVSSTLGSTLTTILVVVPVLFVPGPVGALFSQLAITIVCLLSIAFLCSATLAPALWILLPQKPSAESHPTRPMWDVIRLRYHRLLPRLFSSIRILLGVYLLVVAGCTALFLTLPRSVLPPATATVFAVSIELPPGTDIDQTRRVTADLVEKISGRLPAAGIYAFTGSSTIGRHPLRPDGPHKATLMVSAGPGGGDVERLIHSAAWLPSGAETRVTTAPVRTAFEELLTGEGGDRVIQVRGISHEQAMERARALAGAPADTGVTEGLTIKVPATTPTYFFNYDAEAASLVGLSGRSVGEQLQFGIEGIRAGRIELAGDRLPVRVRTKTRWLDTKERLEQMVVESGTNPVPLGAIGRVIEQSVAAELHRTNRMATVTVSVPAHQGTAVVGSPSVFTLPEDTRGYSEILSHSRLQRASGDLGRVFLLALLLMFLVLASQFGSATVAVLLIAALPLSTVGSLLALSIVGGSINLSSVIGLLILLGTTMNTTILLTDIRQNGKDNMIQRNSEERLIPILATTLTTIAALLPMAVFRTHGDSGQSAVVVIGGLFVGTILVLTVYPAFLRCFVGFGHPR